MRIQVLVLAGLLAQPVAAETLQHGNIIFDVPKGWYVGGVDEKGTLTLLTDLPDDECEFCYIRISIGQDGQTQPDSFLASQATRFIDDDDDVPRRDVISPPERMTAGGRPAAMMGQLVDGDVQILFATQLSDRLEIMAFDGESDDEEELTTSMQVFQRDVAPMFENARYVSEGADPLMPAPEAGDLSGLYWGFRTEWRLQLDGTMQMEIVQRRLVFWPDGYFYDGRPPQGLLLLDPQALLAIGDMDFGTYQLSRGTLRLGFASGKVEELGVEGETFLDGNRTMYLAEPVADGETFAGNLSSISFEGFSPGSGVTGGVSRSSFAEFRTDGTWSGEHSGGAFGSFENASGDNLGGYATSGGDSYGGRYEVKDGLLYRYFDNGDPPDVDLIYRISGDLMIGDQTVEPPG